MMDRYDPEISPDAEAWLALDEQLRIMLVEQYHRAARIDVQNLTLHATFHAIVENQLAEGLEAVDRALMRLMHEGLPRHDAVHAIGSVLSEQIWSASQPQANIAPEALNAHYIAAVERLTAAEWHRKFGVARPVRRHHERRHKR